LLRHIQDKLDEIGLELMQGQLFDLPASLEASLSRVYEPISFDLLEESAIREKANKWLGRSLCLNESSDAFKLTFLLGAPQSSRLRDAFQHAENILNKIPAKKEIVREEEAESFAQELESQLKNSNPEQVA
jgi:hypothetical protein